MRIYVFRSEVSHGLRAFTGDVSGARLPDQFRPWHSVGEIGADENPPHQLPRAQIEQAISDQGFQLWRMRSKPKPAAKKAKAKPAPA